MSKICRTITDIFEISDSKLQISNSKCIEFQNKSGIDIFVPNDAAEEFLNQLKSQNAVEISDELDEVWRIENGIPKYGVDMDDATIVPEIGLPELISYQKGCYIGQEIIARIHFRGHVAKQLTGLIFDDENAKVQPNDELKSHRRQKRRTNYIRNIFAETRKNNCACLCQIRFSERRNTTES